MASKMKTTFTSRQISVKKFISWASKGRQTYKYTPSVFRHTFNREFCGTPLELLTALELFSANLYSYYFSEYPMERDENGLTKVHKHMQLDHEVLYGCCCFAADSRLAVVIAFGSTKEVALNACCTQLIAIYIDRHMASYLLENFRSCNQNNFVLYSEPVACAESERTVNALIKEEVVSPEKVVDKATTVPISIKEEPNWNVISADLPDVSKELSASITFNKITTIISGERASCKDAITFTDNDKEIDQKIDGSGYEHFETTSKFTDKNIRFCTSPSDRRGKAMACHISSGNSEQSLVSKSFVEKSSEFIEDTIKSECCSDFESSDCDFGQNQMYPEIEKMANTVSAIVPKSSGQIQSSDPSLHEELKLLIAKNKPLLPAQNRKFAALLTQANNYPTPALKDYRLEDAITVDEFFAMDQFPKNKSVHFQPQLLVELNSRRVATPNRIFKMLKPWCRNCSFRDFSITDRTQIVECWGKRLIFGLRTKGRQPTAFFKVFASTDELATQACYAKFIQHCLQETSLAKKSLLFFMEMFSTRCNKPLVLFHARKPELPLLSVSRERKSVSPASEEPTEKANNPDSVLYPAIEVRKFISPVGKDPAINEKKRGSYENEILKRKLSELKQELTKLGIYDELQTAKNCANFIFDSYTLTEFRHHEYVHSLNVRSMYSREGKKRHFLVTLNVNDLYLLSNDSTIGFDDAFQRTLQKALKLVNVIKSRPEELIIPYHLVGDHQLILNFLKMKTGLSDSSIRMKFKSHAKGWRARMYVDNVTYKTKRTKKTQLEAATLLVLSFLRKHECSVLKIK